MRTVALYGNSLVVSTIGASLQGRAGLEVKCVDATLPDAVSRLRALQPDKGFNSRLAPLQAAFLRVKLRRLDEWNQRRRLVAAAYLEGLGGFAGLQLPVVPSSIEPAWHLFVIQHPRRDELQNHLTQSGIGPLIHYPVPPHLSQAYSEMGLKPGRFPISESMGDCVLSLPHGPHIPPTQVQTVIDAVRGFGP